MDPERTLALELVAMMTLTTLNGLRRGSMPGPSSYVGVVILYGMLSGAALFGPGPGRVAAALGGLAVLAALVVPTVTDTHVGTSGTDLAQTTAALVGELGRNPHTTSPGIVN